MIIRSVDFESTGVPTEEDRHAICEVGITDIIVEDGPLATNSRIELRETIATLTRPGRPMPPEARAVHHISDAMIERDGIANDKAALMLMGSGDRPHYFCAHNADFEREFFAGGGVPWVDTYKVALRFWPDAPAHSLQVLRYALNLDCDEERAMPPHRAGPDSYVGAALMARILREAPERAVDIETLSRWSTGPALLPRITFGTKHKGQKWEEAETSYLQWIVDKSDLDRDKKANARFHLKQLAGA